MPASGDPPGSWKQTTVLRKPLVQSFPAQSYNSGNMSGYALLLRQPSDAETSAKSVGWLSQDLGTSQAMTLASCRLFHYCTQVLKTETHILFLPNLEDRVRLSLQQEASYTGIAS